MPELAARLRASQDGAWIEAYYMLQDQRRLDEIFERGFTAGRGFTALAIMIFGAWNPLGAMFAAIFFGLTQGVASQLQSDAVFEIPPQFVNMLPYVLTIVLLAAVSGRVSPPAAVGKPYEKD